MFGAAMASATPPTEQPKNAEQFELQQNLQKQIDRLRSERKDLHQKTENNSRASWTKTKSPVVAFRGCSNHNGFRLKSSKCLATA